MLELNLYATEQVRRRAVILREGVMFFEIEEGGGGGRGGTSENYVYGTEIKGNSPGMRHF